MTTVHRNVPSDATVAEQAETDAPDPMVVAIVAPGVKPLPLTTTETPLGPCPTESAIVGLVTVNVPEAVSAPTSVATTDVPLVPPGTAKVQLNAPEASVVSEPEEHAEIVTPSKTRDASAAETEKPVPDTVTEAPFGPWPGDTVIEGDVTVNEAAAEPPPASVATTAVPLVPAGTVNVQENAPVALVVREPEAQAEIATPSSTREASGVETEKPEPETVTVAPIGPWPGAIEIDGVVTVNEPLADRPPTSVATTVEPEVPAGTTSVHEKLPEEPVVSEPEAQLAIITPSKLRDARAEETLNPLPVTVTEAPLGPWPGVTVIAGVVTVKVWLDVLVDVATSVARTA
jgi:hypothetical protein